MSVKEVKWLRCYRKRKKMTYGYWKTELLHRQPEIWFYHDVMSSEYLENQNQITASESSTNRKVCFSYIKALLPTALIFRKCVIIIFDIAYQIMDQRVPNQDFLVHYSLCNGKDNYRPLPEEAFVRYCWTIFTDISHPI